MRALKNRLIVLSGSGARGCRRVHVARTWIGDRQCPAAQGHCPRRGFIHHRQGPVDDAPRLAAHRDDVGEHGQSQRLPLLRAQTARHTALGRATHPGNDHDPHRISHAVSAFSLRNILLVG